MMPKPTAICGSQDDVVPACVALLSQVICQLKIYETLLYGDLDSPVFRDLDQFINEQPLSPEAKGIARSMIGAAQKQWDVFYSNAVSELLSKRAPRAGMRIVARTHTPDGVECPPLKPSL